VVSREAVSTPDGAPEIYLILFGKGARASTDSTADQSAFERSADNSAAQKPNAGTDAGAADRSVAGAIAACAEHQRCAKQDAANNYSFHSISPAVVPARRKSRRAVVI
jgi:hypothetical protein